MKSRKLIDFLILLSLGAFLWGMFTSDWTLAFFGFTLAVVLADSWYRQKKLDALESLFSELKKERDAFERQASRSLRMSRHID